MKQFHYILNSNHQPIPAARGSLEFKEFFENISRRRVAETTIGDFWISTVFLGIDHNYSSSGPPILFETMVQNNKIDDWTGPDGEEIQERCSTWDEALAQHERVVEEIRKQIEQIK